MADNLLKTIGIFGGTFDPIHFGHLRAAIELFEELSLDEIRLIPGKHPPHRMTPLASPEDRLNMIHLAIQGTPLTVDDREMRRDGPSYSIDTLMSLRREYPKASLCMFVGADAFLGLTTWFQWEKLIQLANIIVMQRSGFNLPVNGAIAELIANHRPAENEPIHKNPYGRIFTQNITLLEISASNIRHRIQNKKSPAFLIPDSVHEYIQRHGLYGYDKIVSVTQQETIHV